MNKTYKDTDLREALRRKYSDTPQLPADFMAKMEERLEAKPVAKTRRLWTWVAAAACIFIMIGIGITMMKDRATQPEQQMAETQLPSDTTTHVAQAPRPTYLEPVDPRTSNPSTHVARLVRTGRTESPQATDQASADDGLKAAPHDAEPQSDPNLHYATYEVTKDTVPYQDPARVDDFIAKLADNYQVKQGELTCAVPADSNMVSSVYVFPDTKEIDVFGKLLQVACWYKCETPGYHLNFSQQQFFFELKDMRRGLQYRWIAERINGKILLYGTNAPIGVETSSACYQEYRNELMHINSINHKTKEI